MAESNSERDKSTFVAFWSSLPGILTGIAAVIGAVAALAALLIGNNAGSKSPSSGTSVPSQPQAASSASSLGTPVPSNLKPAPSATGGGCLVRYFRGIPGDRVAQVEAGTKNFDFIAANQPKPGSVGLTFTNNNHVTGALRLAFFPASQIFKIESVVDQRCRTVEDYANSSEGGDKHILQNYDTVRLRLGGALYALNLGSNSTTLSLNFLSVAP